MAQGAVNVGERVVDQGAGGLEGGSRGLLFLFFICAFAGWMGVGMEKGSVK